MKLLTKMLEQFKTKHDGTLPTKIVVEPLALLALGLKRSIAPMWAGIPVVCREFKAGEIKKPGTGSELAVAFGPQENQLVAFEI
jgi:hypothetical protein